MTLSVESDVSPKIFFLYQTQTDNSACDIFPAVKAQDMAPMTPYPDSTRRYISAGLPHSAQARAKALVVLPHGGPHGVRDYWQLMRGANAGKPRYGVAGEFQRLGRVSAFPYMAISAGL